MASRGKIVGAAIAAITAVGLSTPPAVAQPNQIYYGLARTRSGYYEGFAYFKAGSGVIRATLRCNDGGSAHTLYGPWKTINITSYTSNCAQELNEGGYQTAEIT